MNIGPYDMVIMTLSDIQYMILSYHALSVLGRSFV